MWPFTKKPKNTAKARDKPAAHAAPTHGRFLSVYRARADATMRGNEAIYAAVSRIANTVASMPLHLYKGYELQTGHPLEALVSLAPNVNFTPFGWLQTMEAFRNTEGNAYALIVPDKLGAPTRLDILDPTKVRPQRQGRRAQGNLHRCVLICNPCGVFRRAAGLPERKVIQWQLFEITASRPRPT